MEKLSHNEVVNGASVVRWSFVVKKYALKTPAQIRTNIHAQVFNRFIDKRKIIDRTKPMFKISHKNVTPKNYIVYNIFSCQILNDL